MCINVGGVLAAKAQADDQLHKARHKVKEVVHALHKAQDVVAVQEASNEDIIINITIIIIKTIGDYYTRISLVIV